MATILMIFLIVLPKIFLWPHYSGAPRARGPRFIEPLEPRVPTPLLTGYCWRKFFFIFFWMPFLSADQQCQSSEWKLLFVVIVGRVDVDPRRDQLGDESNDSSVADPETEGR